MKNYFSLIAAVSRIVSIEAYKYSMQRNISKFNPVSVKTDEKLIFPLGIGIAKRKRKARKVTVYQL